MFDILKTTLFAPNKQERKRALHSSKPSPILQRFFTTRLYNSALAIAPNLDALRSDPRVERLMYHPEWQRLVG